MKTKAKVLILELLLTAGLLSTQHAFAEPEDGKKAAPPVQQSGGVAYGELDMLRSQNAILEAQLKNAELKNKLDTARGVSPSSGAPSKSRQSIAAYIDRSARVQLVAGIAGRLTATIQLSDGGNTVARVGTRIPNLGVVKSIKTDEVIVENGREVISIPFASEPVSNATQYAAPYSSSPQSGAMVPPLSLPPVGRN